MVRGARGASALGGALAGSAAFGPAGGRSDCIGGAVSGCASGFPHSTQNFMFGWFRVPQRLHGRSLDATAGDAGGVSGEAAGGAPQPAPSAARATGVGSGEGCEGDGDDDAAGANAGACAPAIRVPHCWQ